MMVFTASTDSCWLGGGFGGGSGWSGVDGSGGWSGIGGWNSESSGGSSGGIMLE